MSRDKELSGKRVWEQVTGKLGVLAAFCDKYCPVCTRSRRPGSRLKGFVRFYHKICPFCRARERETGRKPWEART